MHSKAQNHIPKFEAKSLNCYQKRSEKWLHLTEERAQVFRSSRQDFCAEGLGTGAEIYLRRGSRSQSEWKRLIVFSSQYVAELTATTCCG